MQTNIEFELAITDHVTRMWIRGRLVESLTQEGVKVAQQWLCERYGNNQPRRAKRLATLRGFAYNLKG